MIGIEITIHVAPGYGIAACRALARWRDSHQSLASTFWDDVILNDIAREIACQAIAHHQKAPRWIWPGRTRDDEHTNRCRQAENDDHPRP